jgi:hypothetical protein
MQLRSTATLINIEDHRLQDVNLWLKCGAGPHPAQLPLGCLGAECEPDVPSLT